MAKSLQDSRSESFYDQKVWSAKLSRIDALVAELARCPDAATRESARELVSTLLELHRLGLDRAMGLVSGHDGSGGLMTELGKDPLVSGMLLLHDLHPAALAERISAALEQVRPALKAHQGNVELVELAGDLVRLRLEGTCNGCPSSKSTFKNLIESAIHGMAPEIERIEVEGLT